MKKATLWICDSCSEYIGPCTCVQPEDPPSYCIAGRTAWRSANKDETERYF